MSRVEWELLLLTVFPPPPMEFLRILSPLMLDSFLLGNPSQIEGQERTSAAMGNESLNFSSSAVFFQELLATSERSGQ